MSKNPETIALHGGDYRSDPATTAVAVPLYRTTSYQFNDTGHAANLFALKELVAPGLGRVSVAISPDKLVIVLKIGMTARPERPSDM